MKRLLNCMFACIFFNSYFHVQSQDDPFKWTKPIVIPGSFYVLSGEGPHSDSITPHLNTYFLNGTGLSVERLRKDSLNLLISGNHKINLEVTDMDNNGADEVIGAGEGQDSEVIMNIFQPNNSLNVPVNGHIIQGGGERSRIVLKAGDFDGDERDEFLLAYIGEDTTIHINIYDVNSSNEVYMKASIQDENLSGNPTNKFRFAVTTGDFDNNGDDEIALVSYDDDTDGEYEQGVYIKIYDVSGSFIIPKVKSIVLSETYITDSDFSVNDIVLSVTNVPGYILKQDMIAYALTTIHNEGPNVNDTYLQMVKTGNDLNSIISDENTIISDYHNSNYLPSLSLASGDIDNNQTAELVFSYGPFYTLYLTDDNLVLSHYTGGGFAAGNDGDDLHDSYDFLELGNVDDIPGDELLIVKNVYSISSEDELPQGFTILVKGITTDTLSSFTSKGSITHAEEIPYDWPFRTYAFAVGNFENTRTTIQAPTSYFRSDISQPIIILNAPPIHFDNFNGVNYDVNTCYSNEDCDFTSSYIKITSATDELTTQIQSSWDISGGISNQGSIGVAGSTAVKPFGIGVEVEISYTQNFEYHLLAEYGAHFENTTGTSQTSTVEINIDAKEDDQIFAVLTDYHIWEYPYFIGNQTEKSGVILAFKPIHSESRWFPSKSVSGYAYRPNHEPGNILSYYPYDSIEKNPDVFQYIQPGALAPTFVLSSNSSYNWQLNNETFTSNNALEGVNFGVDAGFLGFGYTASFKVNDARVYTHKTTIAENLELAVQLGGINRTIGPTEYRVTPYAYWSNEGALVIDFGVEPEIDPTSADTWWEEIYGNDPDPTMILPWRLDPEKGFAITDESKRQQTKDIQLKPSYVADGDSILVTANIRNFSLVNTPAGVKARFYLGNPSDGGELISDIEGKSYFETDGIVPARGFKPISFVWVPPDNSTEERLYMVLDPDNDIQEIHENNNTGWISIQDSPDVGEYHQVTQPFNGLTLMQNFPNPFSQSTEIKYIISGEQEVILNIYDIFGKKVKSYNEGSRIPGNYSITIDRKGLTGGIYFYSIGSEHKSGMCKMVIIP